MKQLYVNTTRSSNKIIWLRDFLLSSTIIINIASVFSPFHPGTYASIFSSIFGIIIVALCLVCDGIKEKKFPFKIIVAAVLFLAAVIFFRSFARGFITFVNNFISVWCSLIKVQPIYFNTANASVFDVTLFFVLTTCVIATAVESFLNWKLHTVLIISLFIIDTAIFLITRSSNIFSVIFFCIAVVYCWIAGNNKKIELSAKVIIFSAITTSTILAVYMIFSPFGGFRQASIIYGKTKSVTHDMMYHHDSLPHGNLLEAYKMMVGNESRLLVKTDLPQEEYLTGFVGTELNGTIWEEMSYAALGEDWQGLYRWLKSNGFASQYIYADYYNKMYGDILHYRMSVTNIGADRSYVYIPFSTSFFRKGSYKISNDLSVVSNFIFGSKSYSLSFVPTDNLQNDLISYKNINTLDISNTLAVYNAFAHSAYMNVSSEDEEILDEVFFNTDYLNEESGILSILSRIRAVLNLRCTYSDSPQPYNSSKSFTDWFLNDSTVGNSAYYATVGTLAIRAAGYPARYAEGYYIPEGAGNTVELTTKNAHAWVEVYLDNLGWIPFEVTPGYYDNAVFSEQTVEISKDQAGSPSNTQNPYAASEQYDDAEPEMLNADKSNISYILLPILCFILFLIVKSAFWLTRRRIILIKRKKAFASSQPEYEIYRCIFEIFRLGGVVCDQRKPLECTNAVIEKFEGVIPEEYRRMVSLMQKTVFGQIHLEEFEIMSIMLFYKKIRKILYAKSSRFKKFMLKYFNVI